MYYCTSKNCDIDLATLSAELIMENILIHNSKIFCCYQGYLLYRDVNNHSMTAIRISPETLEQDGTVMLPGMLLTLSFVFFTVSLRDVHVRPFIHIQND